MQARVPPASTPDVHGDGPAPAASDPVRILVVDDRSENLLAVRSILQDPTYELVLAQSGVEALRFLLHQECALILLDVQMPELDGFETARLVRGNSRTRAIPIVFMTAVSREERFITRGYQSGAIDYLLKPIDPDVLRAKVAAFVELHRARQEVVRQAALLRERDRTERQRAVEQMELRHLRRQQAASERYRRLMDGISHAIVWSADPVTLTCTLVSRSAEVLLGRPTDAWTRRPASWDELLPEPERAGFLEALRRAAGGEVVNLDHGFVRGDGSVARFRTELRTFGHGEPGEQGELERPELRGFSVDVTEARLAEEALGFLARAGAELFSSLDLQETIARLAALAVPFLGDACGVTLSLPDGERSAFAPAPAEAAAAALRDAGPSAGERAGQPRRLRDGSGRWALEIPFRARERLPGTIRLLRAPGRPFGPRELHVAGELAERAGHALENALLYREAREAIQVREEFISVASHELRTPLTALTLQARLLERSLALECAPAAPAKITQRVVSVGRQVERMSRLVANLLDVTRLRVNRMDLQPERLDLSGLVEEVAGRFQEELARAGRALRLACPGPLLGSWDRIKLEQVLTNLLSNAVRYGGDGPVDVEVRPDGDEVRVAVRDSGRGIAPEDQARVFQRFERGRNADGSGGLGLGLYIVRSIVEAHGGRIELASALGAGSEFTVRLPFTGSLPAATGAEA
jgi:signal transduction histidine kinase/DNA-binding response OmpR family regulator